MESKGLTKLASVLLLRMFGPLLAEEAAPQVAVQMQPLQREPAAQHAPLPASPMASTSRGPATGTSN